MKTHLYQKVSCLFWVLLLFNTDLHSQYFNFSQYNQTPLRVNPAYVAASDYEQFNLIYRDQNTSERSRHKSGGLSYQRPFGLRKSGWPFLGIGLFALNDRSGNQALINTQNYGISTGVNIRLSENQSLSFGMSGMIKNMRFSLDNLTTGSQYNPVSGHNPDASIGEGFSDQSKTTFGLSTGVLWLKTGQDGSQIAHLGVGLYDLNQPKEFIQGPNKNHIPITSLIQFGFRLYQNSKFTIYPQALGMLSGNIRNVNTGIVWGYTLEDKKRKKRYQLELHTNYNINSYGSLGIQIQGKNFRSGISYDIGSISTQNANQGAVEISFTYRRPVRRKIEPIDVFEQLISKKTPYIEGPSPRLDIEAPVVLADTLSSKRESSIIEIEENNSMLAEKNITTTGIEDHKEIIEEANPVVNDKEGKIESETTTLSTYSPSTSAGDLIYSNVQLEKINITCEFDFDKALLRPMVSDYLDKLAKRISSEKIISIEIIGHTDQVGAEAYNVKLSTRRAQSIAEFLAKQGIPWSKMSLTGKGESQPLPGNPYDHKNRRVEVLIFSQLPEHE